MRVWAGALPKIDVTNRTARLALNPIVRARLDDRLTPEEYRRRYGTLITCYDLVDDARDAEVAVFPTVLEQAAPESFRAFLRTAESNGLRTLAFSGHDLEPVMPSESVILLHPGPTRGAQPKADVLALPYLFTDRAGPDEVRPDGQRPSVAFCGQGATRAWTRAGQMLVRAARQLSNRIRPRVIAPPLAGHVGLRATALELLHQHPGVDDHFVIRDQYRAGATSEEDRERTQADFDDNLRSSMYALCVRGTGNFSARFYESLSFGRVPIFVDTRCVLPFEDLIDWKSRTVWVDSGEVTSIGKRLVAAHPSVLTDPDRTRDSLRGLWEEYLTSDGYFTHLPEAIRQKL